MRTEELGHSLLAAFARVPDGRSRPGRRSPVPALLTLATAAMLCGARSVDAISQWGRLPPGAVRQALGFLDSDGDLPAATTRHDVCQRLEVEHFEATRQTWASETLDGHSQQGVLDGQALRGLHGDELPGVRLVAASAPEAGRVLAHAGGQDPRGASGDGGGARAGQTGGRTQRCPTPAAPDPTAAGGSRGQWRCALVSAGAVPPDWAGGRRCSLRRQSQPARPARRRDAAGSRPTARRVLRDGGHGQYAWRAAGRAPAAGRSDAGGLAAGGRLASRRRGAGRDEPCARAAAPRPARAPGGALLPDEPAGHDPAGGPAAARSAPLAHRKSPALGARRALRRGCLPGPLRAGAAGAGHAAQCAGGLAPPQPCVQPRCDAAD